MTVAYTVNHEDGSTETGTFLSPDWFNSTGPAFTSNGRVDVAAGLFTNMNSGFPRLYPADIVQISTNSPITTFTPIASGTLSLPDARNAAGATIDPLTQVLPEVPFANSTRAIACFSRM